MAIDTKTVKGRRRLRFADYREMLADVDVLHRGPTRRLGNWSLGQICTHLAVTMNSCIDGPPFRPPWYVRFIGPRFKQRVLTKGMVPGFKLPQRGSKLDPGETNDAEGVECLVQAVRRVQNDPTRVRHVIFGPLTHAEWDQFFLRHAELHLSFLVPESQTAQA